MKKLEWLEAMRGIAACWVLVSHTSLALRDFAHSPSPHVLANGFLGVDFFFVLSGFIIAFSSQQLLAKGRGWKDYATARAIRIYVPYLPVGIALLVLYSVFPTLSQGSRSDISLLSTFTLLPSNAPPALSVAWTLVHEIIFYALFSVFFVSRPALLALLVAWCAAIAVVWANHIAVPPALGYFFSPLNLCFVLGVGVAWATQRGVGNRLGAVLAVAGGGLVLSQAFVAGPNRPAIAIGFACLVAASRSSLAMQRSPGRILLTLGAASYAIYLVHNTAISIGIRAALHIPSTVAMFLAVSAFALAAGLAYHFFYERFALEWVRSRVRRAAPATPAPAVAAPAGLTIETSAQNAEGVRERLRSYARLTFTETKPWWSGTVTFTVTGDETARARAQEEIENWLEEELLRKAW